MAITLKEMKELEHKIEDKWKEEVKKYGMQKVMLYCGIGAFIAYVVLHSLLEH